MPVVRRKGKKFSKETSSQPTRFSKRKPKLVSANKVAASIRLLAFSDWRAQRIGDIIKFLHGIQKPIDFILYGGDDIRRFEQDGINYFSRLSEYARSKRVLAVIGNDDTYIQKRVLSAKGVHDLYDQSLVYKNFAFIGLEASTSRPALFRHEEEDFQKHLKRQSRAVAGKKLVVLSHAPPYGILDRGIRYSRDDEFTTHIGTTALTSFIETNPVCIVICGHCHSQGGLTSKFGNTTIANVSSHDNPGAKGNFAIIELTSDGVASVEWHDTHEILGKDSLTQLYGVGRVRADKLVKCGINNIKHLAQCRNLDELARSTKFGEKHLRLLQLRAKSMLNNQSYQLAPFALHCDKAIFFDIETDIGGNRVWLIGYEVDGQFFQLYADSWEEERDILEMFLKVLEENLEHALVSFSGTNFDLRVLLKASQRFGLDKNLLLSRHHIDLSSLLRKCFIFPNQRFALKKLGSFLGYEFKHSELDGLQVALNYHRHVEKGKPLDHIMLEYNEDDVKVIPYIINEIRNRRFKINERARKLI